jgi:transcriptional regulator with XRE-family HTH domain
MRASMRVSEYDTTKLSLAKLRSCNERTASYAQRMGFGERLRDARKDKKLTGEELGRRVGMTKAGISHWEKDRYEPNLAQLTALADELEVTADWLLGREHPSLSADALKEALAYESLSPDDRRRWRTLRQTMFSTVPH